MGIKKLAIYDSGLGGYCVFHDLKQHFPQLEMTLFADQKNAPYGNKSYEDLLDVSIKAIESIAQYGYTDILVACNTISATSLSTLKLMFPDLNIIGIIDLTVAQVEGDDVAILATQATIASKVYQTKLADKNVTGIALSKLANLIESLTPDETIKSYLESFDELLKPYDTLVLGCTHYPLIKPILREVVQGDLLDSRVAIRNYLEPLVSSSTGTHKVLTSGSSNTLSQQIESLFKEKVEVDLWNL